MKQVEDSGIWFSYKQKRYSARKVSKRFLWIKQFIPQNRLFNWSDEPEIWDWQNCQISSVGMNNERVRIVARRQKVLDRKEKRKGDKIWLMLGIIATDVSDIQDEDYNEPVPHNPPDREIGSPIRRWAFHMTVQNSGDEKTHIADATIWCKDDADKPPKKLVDLHNSILKHKGNPEHSNVFEVETDREETIFPVIYQPRVDAHDNYIRSIFCHKKGNSIEFSLVFNDEELNNAWFFDFIYRHIRRWKYGRIKDLESFSVILDNQKPVSLKFPGIYSGCDDLKHDTTHGDRKLLWIKAPLRDINYFYSDEYHPVIFVNTSNHAMAESDNNPQFWKWEYAGWEDDTPLVTGGGSKQSADAMLKEKAIKENPCGD